MRKIFIFALVALAGTLVSNAQSVAGKMSQISESAMSELETVCVDNNTVYKAPANAASVNDVLGTYTWYYKSGLSGTSGNGNTGTITVTENTDVTNGVSVKLTINSNNYFTIPGVLDAEKGTITLNKTILGQDTDGDYMVFEWYDWTGSSPIAQESPVVLTVDNKRIVTPSGLVWGVGLYGKDDNKMLGYYMLTYNNFIWGDFTWEEVATDVSYTDNFFAPMFAKTNQTTTLTVYEAKEVPGVYKFDNFFGVFGADLPACLMDCTNPDRVYIPVQSSGVTATGRGMTWYTNAAGVTRLTTDALPYPADKTKSCNMTCVKKDGEVTINMPQGACRFNWVDYSAGIGAWYYNSSTADTKITFTYKTSGVADVEAAENAPVEYYTLQGMKVANPAAGSIVICRQGSKVSKLIVK